MNEGGKPHTRYQEENISQHAVTERWRCYAMEQKYSWTLLRIERTGQKTLKWNCVFEGKTEFPDYHRGRPMRKYIIFRADPKEEHGAESRLLSHTGAYTEILAEQFDSSNRPLPAPGYRLREFHQISQFTDPNFPSASTHSRVGDWEVARVEEYVQTVPNVEFDSIIVCYCRYAPVTTALEPLPQIQVSQDMLQEVL